MLARNRCAHHSSRSMGTKSAGENKADLRVPQTRAETLACGLSGPAGVTWGKTLHEPVQRALMRRSGAAARALTLHRCTGSLLGVLNGPLAEGVPAGFTLQLLLHLLPRCRQAHTVLKKM